MEQSTRFDLPDGLTQVGSSADDSVTWYTFLVGNHPLHNGVSHTAYGKHGNGVPSEVLEEHTIEH